MNIFAAGFWVLAVITVAASVLVVYNRNPIVSALYLALSFISASGLFILLHADFLALVQVLIYAGAVVILFVYVIMLLDLAPEKLKGVYGMLVQIIGAVMLVTVLFAFLFNMMGLKGMEFPPLQFNYATIYGLANELFTKYVIPFELVSVILLIGIIGAVLLVKRVEKTE